MRFHSASVIGPSTLLAILGMLSAASALAAPLAYEGFSPGGGTANVVGTSDGTGFSAAWINSVGTGAMNRTGDNNNMTSFPANVTFATPTGGKLQKSAANYADVSITRALTTPLSLDANGSFYMSFLFNDYAAATSAVDRETRVFLGNSSLRLHVGPTYTDQLGIAHNNATAEPFVSPIGRADSATSMFGFTGDPLLFVVAQFNTQAVGNDSIRLKGYSYSPGGGLVATSPGSVVWDATYTFTGTGSLDRLGVYMEGLGFPEVDEIRLGTTWKDVTSLGDAAISVTGNSQTVADGSTTPSTANLTDWGAVASVLPQVNHQFTLTNTSDAADLILSSIVVPDGFSLVEGLPAFLAPGASDTFTIGFTPLAVGMYSGNVVITSNAPGGSAVFTYAVQATLAPEPASIALWLSLGLMGSIFVWRSRRAPRV